MPTHPSPAAQLHQSKSAWQLHRRIYDWMIHWAQTPYGMLALIMISFAESSFFPIPPDVLLIAMVLASPHRWIMLASVCTLASVAGGIFGYGIGMYAWESFGQWIIRDLLHISMVMVDGKADIPLPPYLVDNFSDLLGGRYIFQIYDHWNAWIVGIFGLTPLPYKLVTITAGVAQIDLLIFTVTSVISRGARFFVVAGILALAGKPAKALIEKHFNLATIVFVALLLGGFLAVKLLLKS